MTSALSWLRPSRSSASPKPSLDYSFKNPLASAHLQLAREASENSGYRLLGHVRATLMIFKKFHFEYSSLHSANGSLLSQTEAGDFGQAHRWQVRGRHLLCDQEIAVTLASDFSTDHLLGAGQLFDSLAEHFSVGGMTEARAYFPANRRVYALWVQGVSATQFEGKTAPVAMGTEINEATFAALPWPVRSQFELAWDAENQQFPSLSCQVKAIGRIEIKLS